MSEAAGAGIDSGRESPDRRSDRLLARLSRITTSGRLIPEIDGLRFFAIALVVAAHAGTWATIVYGWGANPGAPDLFYPNSTGLTHSVLGLLRLGVWGVPLFFIISGFILGVPFASRYLADASPVRLGPYFLRRLTRLEPPYVIALFATFSFMVLLPDPPASIGELSSGLAWGIPYLANLRGGNSVLGVAWSLEIEIQFYILMPLLAYVFAIRSTVLRRGFLVSAIVLSVFGQGYLLPATVDPQRHPILPCGVPARRRLPR